MRILKQTIAYLLLAILITPTSSLSALTVQQAVNSLQATDPALPSGVANPKGSIGYILSSIFGTVGNSLGKIQAQYIDYSGISTWTQLGANTYLTTTTGSVGIGTISPAYKLDVLGIVNATAFRGDGSVLTGITPSQIGLGLVNNTSDANKPVSIATQTILDLKANLASPSLTGTPTAPTPLTTDSSTTLATTAFVKGQSYITSAGSPVQSVSGRTGVVTLSQADIAGLTTASSPSFAGITATTFNGTLNGNATTSSSSPFLSALGNYIWSAATLPTGYPQGIQSSFVQGTSGFPNYGSVMNINTYSGGGGALQLFTPYSPTYGGSGLQVRFGNYDVSNGNSWTPWKTLLANDNYNSYSPTLTGGGASGTWGINITGNATTASNLTNFSVAHGVNPDTKGTTGIHYFAGGATSPYSDGTLIQQAYQVAPTTWGSQIMQDYRTGKLAVRGLNNTSWTSWLNVIDSSTIGSQSVSYATNSTKLYASDSPYRYGDAAPYYMNMTYDGTRWLLQASPASPAAIRVAYADVAGSAGSIPWSGVTGKPSALSAFTNDSAYITNNNSNYLVTAGNGNGICFWADCTNYKLSMSNTADYQYGPVTDYSLKLTMGAGGGRGITFGTAGTTPIGSINTTSGNMQIAGQMTATQFNGSLNGNATTATAFSTVRTNYKGITDATVAGEIMWKNYGNGHTIFDASNSTAPNGTVINNTNSQVAWSATYPTLMGWNGSNSYGVRVDSARVADSAPASDVPAQSKNMNQWVNTNSDPTFNSTYYANGNLRLSQGDGTGLRVQTAYGYMNLGAQNSSWTHMYADRPFYFNQDLYVNGDQVVKNSDGRLSNARPANGGTATNLSAGSYYVNPDANTYINSFQVAGGSALINWPGYNGITQTTGNYMWPGFNDGSGWNQSYYLAGNHTYGLYSNTGFDAAGGLWDTGNRVYSATSNPGLFQVNAWQWNHYFGSDGATYATIYYDTNDSGYYVDPNGTSSMNRILLAGRASDWGQTGEIEGNSIVANTTLYSYGGICSGTSSGDCNSGGQITAAGAMYAAAYYYNSDRRLKENIVKIDSPLEKIKKLNGYTFDWKTDGKKDVGVIAQEIEKVFPELVGINESNGMKTVEYGNLVAPIIEAIKELSTKVDVVFTKYIDQQKEIDELRKDVELLKKR